MIVLSTIWSLESGTTTSTLILGTKSTSYSVPRYISVWPFWRPKPRTSVTVMPATPHSVRAALTSSSLKWRMIASTFFTTELLLDVGAWSTAPVDHAYAFTDSLSDKDVAF